MPHQSMKDKEGEGLDGARFGAFYLSFLNCCFRGGGSQVSVQLGENKYQHVLYW